MNDFIKALLRSVFIFILFWTAFILPIILLLDLG